MRPDANTGWFTFDSQTDGFGVYAFSGTEEICKPYEFTIELVHRSPSVDTAKLLGTPACLSIADRSGEKRLVHGLIQEMRQLHTGNAFTHYHCVIVPRISFLEKITDYRIFQDMTVVEIMQQIFKEQGFTSDQTSFNVVNVGQKIEKREYCVQYGETYLHFVTRLCEEEAIFFYHTHTKDNHCIHFYDYKGGPEIAGESDIRFFPGSGQPADTAVIARLNLHGKVNSNAATFKEWNFTHPKLLLNVNATEPDRAIAPAPPGMLLERYKYPHIYQLHDPGERYAKIQLERQLTFRSFIDCESDVSRFLPGHVFSINGHPRADVNIGWFVTSVRHTGEQPGVLEHEAPEGRSLHYNASVTAIPKETRYVPQLEHPKALVTGKQTAIVTGFGTEEIYPDDYGRVKIQFFWDRAGKWDDKTTCWIRVAQGWAGSLFGTEALPRVGHEVIVSFLNGDPDRPLITGRVYHKLNMPPYELPLHKTRTVFKSMSTPGKKGQKHGFNELRIEDKKGQEEIYLHAEKDMDLHVKHDWKDSILNDRHLTIEKFRYSRLKEEQHIVVNGDSKELVKTEDHHTIRGAAHTNVGKRWLVKCGNEAHLQSLMKTVIEAGADLTLQVGPSFVRLVDGSVFIVGPKVSIDGAGEAGEGTPAKPLLPKEAMPPAVPPNPAIGCVCNAAASHNAVVEK